MNICGHHQSKNKKVGMGKVAVLWIAQAISIITSSTANWALIWHVTNMYHSALALSVISLCALLPQGLIAPFAGAFADKKNKKSIIIFSDLSCGLISLLLAIILLFRGYVNLPVYVFCAFRSALSAFHAPALLAFMPTLVSKKNLLRINTFDQLLEGLNFVISPAIGILLYETIGLSAVLVIEFLGALVAVIGILPVRNRESILQGDNTSGMIEKMVEGWKKLLSEKNLMICIIALAVGMLAYSPITTLIPLMTTDYFFASAGQTSLIEVVFGIGMLMGGLILVVWGGGSKLFTLACSSAVWIGIMIAICGILRSTNFSIFVFFIFFIACGCSFFSGPITTIIQTGVPESIVGSVMGVVTSILSFASPIGIAIGGAVAEVVGVSTFFLFDGIFILIAGLIFLALSFACDVDKMRSGNL